MRVFHACLGLCFLATNVLANVWSGPYQLILLWYSYRMDVKTYGAGNTVIAPGCVGSVLTDESCEFDEFLKYIQREPGYYDRWVKWTGSTSVGIDLTPDVIDTGNELKSMTPSYAFNTEDWHKIIPGAFNEGSFPSFTKAYGNLINTIQTIRETAPNLEVPVNIDTELYGAQQSMVLANDGRAYDDAQYKIAYINGILEEKGVDWEVETKQIDSADGQVWEVIDTEATLEAHPEQADFFKTVVKTYVNTWGTSSSKDEGSIKHAKALYTSQVLESTLLGDSTCGIELP
ncbi:hypothetical protein N7490_006063 [Penicillium lividum]|nr:hypothetical protein N7490_006063 [Penicillium lividum]